MRLMCTGRIDLGFLVRAFREGADGVFIGGCWPGECHYVTEGNYDAWSNVQITRRLLASAGVHPERLRLEWVSAAEGTRFAEVMDDFVGTLRRLGPLFPDEGAGDLRREFRAFERLVPFLKLAERERLRVPVKTEAAYRAFYESGEFDELFHALVDERLAQARILTLLEEGPLPQAAIAERLALDPSDVSKHMNSSSRQGLVRYDAEAHAYAHA